MLGKSWGDGLAGILGGVLLSFWDNLGQTEDGQYVSGRVVPMRGLPRVWIVAKFGSKNSLRYRPTPFKQSATVFHFGLRLLSVFCPP